MVVVCELILYRTPVTKQLPESIRNALLSWTDGPCSSVSRLGQCHRRCRSAEGCKLFSLVPFVLFYALGETWRVPEDAHAPFEPALQPMP